MGPNGCGQIKPLHPCQFTKHLGRVKRGFAGRQPSAPLFPQGAAQHAPFFLVAALGIGEDLVLLIQNGEGRARGFGVDVTSPRIQHYGVICTLFFPFEIEAVEIQVQT